MKASYLDGPDLALTEEEHRAMQQQINSDLPKSDAFVSTSPALMRKKASSMDLLFKGPDFKGYFAQRTFSQLSWATLLVLVITLLLLFVIMIAPGWGYTREIRGRVAMEGEMYGKYGLWYACWELIDSPNTHVECRLLSDLQGIPAWFQGCQAMTVLATLFTIISLGNSGAYICAKKFNGNPRLISSVVVLSSISACFAIATFVLFAVKFLLESYWCCASGTMQITQWKLYYCFGICCAVPAFNFLAAILAAMEVSRLRSVERKARYAQELYREKRHSEYNGYGYYQHGYAPQGWPSMRQY